MFSFCNGRKAIWHRGRIFKNITRSRVHVLFGIALLAMLWASLQGQQTAPPRILLSPGSDIQSVVDAAPAGTTFVLPAGTYRMQSIVPKDNDAFIGEGAVVMNGSQLLSPSLDPNGSGFFVASAVAIPAANGICDSTHPLCTFTQDLFIDGQLQTSVATLHALRSGTWYYDRTNNKLYFPPIEGTHIFEFGQTQYAFSGQATGVRISNITVAQYATPGHTGAVGGYNGGANWTVSNVESRWNHGTGICLGPGSQLLNSYIHNNGQMGICIRGGAGSRVMNNEISWNNYAGYSTGWEAGGSKFWSTTNLVLKANYVHNNNGAGLWADTNNSGTLYEGNMVVNNTCSGLMHEVSGSAVVHANIVKDNGTGSTVWMTNAQIQIQNSSGVEVYGNIVEVPINGGNGIGIVNHLYSANWPGPWAANNYIHDNTVTYLGPNGISGGVDDTGGSTAVNNHFDFNEYVLQNSDASHWRWFGQSSILTWRQFVTVGQETNGTCRTEITGSSKVIAKH